MVAGPLIFMHVPDQLVKKNPLVVLKGLHRHLDLVGFGLFTPAIVMLLLALQFGGNQFAWSSSQVIGLFVGAGVTFIIWVGWNFHKGESALIPFFIVKRPAVFSSGINYAFLLATVYGSLYFLPIYFQAVKGVNAIMSGVYLLGIILPQLFTAVIGGSMGKSSRKPFRPRYEMLTSLNIVTKVGYVPPFALVGGALNCIGSGLFSLLQPGTPTGEWVGFSIISGLGRGASLQMVSYSLTF